MIFLYFACTDCKIYLECGHRWAYWQLQRPETVVLSRPVDISAVLAAEQYWNPPQDDNSRWLHEEVFPAVRSFLKTHGDHTIVFCDKDYFAPEIDERFFDWMEAGDSPAVSPRYLAEVVGLRDWEQVRAYIENLQIKPTWWDVHRSEPELVHLARRKFEEVVNKTTRES